jgi:hypothetical protein
MLIRRANDRWPDFESPFCAGGMLMRPYDGAVNDEVFKIGVVS